MERHDDTLISRAEADDLPAILSLQRIAYQSEALLLGNPQIPPLRESLEQLQEQFARRDVFLKATSGSGDIVGSVRARQTGRDALVGKLMVHPQWQGRGLGTRLLLAIERECDAGRYELFTSAKSLRNIALYERAGYSRFREEEREPGLVMVFLQKVASKDYGASRSSRRSRKFPIDQSGVSV